MGLCLLAVVALAAALRSHAREQRAAEMLRRHAARMAEAEARWTQRHREARERDHTEAAEAAADALCSLVRARQEIETWDRT